MSGNRRRKAGSLSTPLQEYDFFIDRQEEEGSEEAPEPGPLKQRKREEAPNKSKAFFLDGHE